GCAAICGAYVAAQRALDRFGLAKALNGSVAAVSVGVVDGESLLDLDYVEDSSAEVDLNVVMTGDGRLVEVQATAERVPFDRERLDDLLDLAADGIDELAAMQREAVDAPRDQRRVAGRVGCVTAPRRRRRARSGDRRRARGARA